MKQPIHPSLYQINTRVWLTEIAEELGKPATLDDIPDKELDRLAGIGFSLDLVLKCMEYRGTRAKSFP